MLPVLIIIFRNGVTTFKGPTLRLWMQAAEKRTQDVERQLAQLQSAKGIASLAAHAATAEMWQHKVRT